MNRQLQNMQTTDIEMLKEEVLLKGNAADLEDLTKRFDVFSDVENVYNF